MINNIYNTIAQETYPMKGGQRKSIIIRGWSRPNSTYICAAMVMDLVNADPAIVEENSHG